MFPFCAVVVAGTTNHQGTLSREVPRRPPNSSQRSALLVEEEELKNNWNSHLGAETGNHGRGEG